jgi:hypothetical protein
MFNTIIDFFIGDVRIGFFVRTLHCLMDAINFQNMSDLNLFLLLLRV